eukprot:scaffold3350_cov268-Pinguiococcus_pyrenoidosus.AAC.21
MEMLLRFESSGQPCHLIGDPGTCVPVEDVKTVVGGPFDKLADFGQGHNGHKSASSSSRRHKTLAVSSRFVNRARRAANGVPSPPDTSVVKDGFLAAVVETLEDAVQLLGVELVFERAIIPLIRCGATLARGLLLVRHASILEKPSGVRVSARRQEAVPDPFQTSDRRLHPQSRER